MNSNISDYERSKCSMIIDDVFVISAAKRKSEQGERNANRQLEKFSGQLTKGRVKDEFLSFRILVF